MSAIKFRKRLTEFKITIALPMKFGSKGFITAVKVIKIYRSSGESNEICISHMSNAVGISPYKSPRFLLQSFKSVGLLVQEKKQIIE